jgi:hypothetical protein
MAPTTPIQPSNKSSFTTPHSASTQKTPYRRLSQHPKETNQPQENNLLIFPQVIRMNKVTSTAQEIEISDLSINRGCVVGRETNRPIFKPC